MSHIYYCAQCHRNIIVKNVAKPFCPDDQLGLVVPPPSQSGPGYKRFKDQFSIRSKEKGQIEKIITSLVFPLNLERTSCGRRWELRSGEGLVSRPSTTRAPTNYHSSGLFINSHHLHLCHSNVQIVIIHKTHHSSELSGLKSIQQAVGDCDCEKVHIIDKFQSRQ